VGSLSMRCDIETDEDFAAPRRGLMWLPVNLRHTVDRRYPRKPAPCPYLSRRPAERFAFAQSTDPQRIGGWGFGCARIDRCSALRAECVHALGTAVCYFYILARLSLENSEPVRRRGNIGAKSRAGQHLAVRAVTDIDCAWLDVGLIGDRAAVASSLYLHEPPLVDCACRSSLSILCASPKDHRRGPRWCVSVSSQETGRDRELSCTNANFRTRTSPRPEARTFFNFVRLLRSWSVKWPSPFVTADANTSGRRRYFLPSDAKQVRYGI